MLAWLHIASHVDTLERLDQTSLLQRIERLEDLRTRHDLRVDLIGDSRLRDTFVAGLLHDAEHILLLLSQSVLSAVSEFQISLRTSWHPRRQQH